MTPFYNHTGHHLHIPQLRAALSLPSQLPLHPGRFAVAQGERARYVELIKHAAPLAAFLGQDACLSIYLAGSATAMEVQAVCLAKYRSQPVKIGYRDPDEALDWSGAQVPPGLYLTVGLLAEGQRMGYGLALQASDGALGELIYESE